VNTAKLLAVFFLASSCATPPDFKNSPCILDPDFDRAYCTPPGHETFEIKLESMGGYACFSLEDTQTLADWIKRHSKNLTTHQRIKLLYEVERVVYAQEQVNNAIR
jgi:hypothetical protein